jgi:hypothetical protein
MINVANRFVQSTVKNDIVIDVVLHRSSKRGEAQGRGEGETTSIPLVQQRRVGDCVQRYSLRP